ncbi:MAG: archaellin/type IV pilin N-terminal domain-containing protein [Candidatus Bathyarchaeia archaeon]
MKILKNVKALSPVVASIILIAVTVAVSLAVAVWMGSLTTGQMQTEKLQITDVRYEYTATVKKVYIDVVNIGSTTSTITDIRIDGITYKNFNSTGNGLLDKTLPYDLEKGDSVTFTITFTTWPFRSGVNYEFTLLTAKGVVVGPYIKPAPSP